MAQCILKGQALADAYAAMLNAKHGSDRICVSHTGRRLFVKGDGVTILGTIEVEPRDARAKLSS